MWLKMAKCNHCNEIVKEAQFSSDFFMPVCPKCGDKRDISIVTAKYVFKRKWYLPWTWLNAGWEEKAYCINEWGERVE